jgi:translation initiation factor IF-2
VQYLVQPVLHITRRSNGKNTVGCASRIIANRFFPLSLALAEKGSTVKNLNYWLLKQAHIIWIASIVNIGLGVVIPDLLSVLVGLTQQYLQSRLNQEEKEPRGIVLKH